MKRSSVPAHAARAIGAALLGIIATGTYAGAAERGSQPAALHGAHAGFPPLENWDVDAKRAIAEVRAGLYPTAKAPQDKATVFRPVTPCRLIDTRGTGSGGAFVLNGPLTPGASASIVTNGLCGIPNSGVAGLSISFHAQNTTLNNGGFISFLQIGGAVSGTNAVFNVGTEWTATTANVSIPNGSGDFYIFVAQSTIEVVVDLNGYYQDLTTLDVGTQQLHITGTGTGETLQVTNASANGTALSAAASGTGGTGFRLDSGKLAVSGAGLNSDTAVFIYEVDTSSKFGEGAGNLCGGTTLADIAVIDHPMLNQNPGAMVFMQLVEPFPGQAGVANLTYVASYTSICDPQTINNYWTVRSVDQTPLADDLRFNIMIVVP